MKKLLTISLLLLFSATANAAFFFTPEDFGNASFTVTEISDNGSFAGTMHVSSPLNDFATPHLNDLTKLEPHINVDILSALVTFFSDFENFNFGMTTNGSGVFASFDDQADNILLNIFTSSITADDNLLMADLNVSANVSLAGPQSSSVSEVPVPAAVWLFASGLLGLIGKRKVVTAKLA